MSTAKRIRQLSRRPSIRELGRDWKHWTWMLDQLALKKPRARRITQAEFLEARQRVLDGCDRCAEDLGAHLAPYFEKLRQHVEPWLTRDTVWRADREIRSDLLTHAHHAQRQLTPRSLPRHAAWLILGLAVVGAASGLAATTDWEAVGNTASVKQIHYSLQKNLYRVTSLTFPQQAYVGGVVLAVVGLLALYKTKKY